MAFFASCNTVGCAQLPPIQPKNSPSEVIIALSPGSPEVGRSRRTTVARAKGTPLASSSWALPKTQLFMEEPPLAGITIVLFSHSMITEILPDLGRGEWDVDVVHPQVPERI